MYYEKYLNIVPKDSGWATDKAFSRSVGCVEGRWDTVPEEGGVILYNHDGKLIADGGDECRHVLVVGATGTGKSRLVIVPSLINSLRAKERRSFVVFDVKGELKRHTLKTAKAGGYDIINIDFRNPSRGSCWNPFYRANALHREGSKESIQKAWKLVEDIVALMFTDGENTRADPFWRNSSANLFRGICHALWGNNHDLSFKQIVALGRSIPTEGDNCKLFHAADVAGGITKGLIDGFRNGSPTTRGNVLCSYNNYLSVFTSRDDVLEMVSSPETVDFRVLGLKPTVLYVTLPDDTTALGSLQGILLTQLMQELNECALENNERLPVRTEMYIDELCNIKPAIPSLETALTIARSRGIRYILAIQSYAQLCGVYREAAETITANCSTWIALNVSKDETFRDKLSRLCGKNFLEKPLIPPSELALLKYEEAIVIRERCAPYFTQLEDIGKVMKRLKSGTPAKGGEIEDA